jgi:glutamyl/glutaminyl-tRNA synthetase
MRGEEFISSTPKFLSLYDALEIPWPQFATMPVILGPDGNKKLSKRDGAKDILDYKKEGYIPEAFINFLAFLGWNPGGEQEVMDVNDIIEAFSLEKVQKGGARFDETKLRWFNHEHLKKLSDEEFLDRLQHYFKEQEISTPEYLPRIVPLLKERSETLGDAAAALAQGEYAFLEEIVSYTPALLIQGAKADIDTVHSHLKKVAELLGALSPDDFAYAAIKEALFPYATQQGRASVLWPMRVALSGREKSPDPFALAELLGKEKSIERIEEAIHIR